MNMYIPVANEPYDDIEKRLYIYLETNSSSNSRKMIFKVCIYTGILNEHIKIKVKTEVKWTSFRCQIDSCGPFQLIVFQAFYIDGIQF